MHLFQALVLGIVEGITEFLPISSTGHLILTARLLAIPQSDFVKNFEIVIQLGAILAVVCLYFRRLFLSITTLKKIVVAFLPTAVLGLLFYKTVKLFLGDVRVVIWSLFLGGFALVLFEYIYSKRNPATSLQDFDHISYKQAFVVGLFQSIALIPGVSRAAATIVGGLLVRIERRAIVEFSFLLAVPTMLAAAGLDLVKNIHSFNWDQFGLLLVGFATAFFVGMIAIKTFLRLIQNHSFFGFGVYRVLLAIVFWFFIL